MERAVDRELPANDLIENEFLDRYNRSYETPEGAKADMRCALSLLNRYCQTLPADQFTQPSVTWSKKNAPGGAVVVSVLLPIQSQIKDEIEVHFLLRLIFCSSN